MNLTQLTVKDLKYVQKLLEKKEGLLSRVRSIDAELEGIGSSGRERGYGMGRPHGWTGGGRKGLLKAKILKVLKATGKEGIHVKDLAKKVKSKEPNIRVWFYATGKKIKQIKQTKPATYAWKD